MGNAVRAAAPAPPMPSTPPPLAVPVPPTSPVPELLTGSSSQQQQIQENELPKVTNPGNYEEFFKKTRELFPALFDGFRLTVNKGLSSCFQVTHTINLSGGPLGSSYKFGSTFVGGTQEDPNPLILGEMDGSGSLSAQIIYQLTSNLKSKLVVQTQGKEFALVQADAEYKSSHSTVTLTLANLDILRETGAAIGHYLHRITDNFDLGTECIYHYGQGSQTTVVSLATRYSQPKWMGMVSLSRSAAHISYYHKPNENIQAGVDYECNQRMQDSTVSLVYQVEVPKANVTFRGLVDTNWTVGSVFEKRLESMPFTFSLSGMLNHSKNTARFGIGLQIG